MADSAVFNEFANVLREQAALVKKLIQLERDFTVSASNDNTDNLENLVKNSQPDLLNFRGLEKKRTKLAAQLGWKGLRSSQILTQLKPEDRDILEPVFQELRESLETLKSTQDAAGAGRYQVHHEASHRSGWKDDTVLYLFHHRRSFKNDPRYGRLQSSGGFDR